MCARVVASAPPRKTRNALSAVRAAGWRGADHRRAAVEHEPVPQHRVDGGGVSNSGRLSVSRCLYSRLLPVRRCGRRVHFFLVAPVPPSQYSYGLSFVRFIFGAISSSYRVGFRHVPRQHSPSSVQL